MQGEDAFVKHCDGEFGEGHGNNVDIDVGKEILQAISIIFYVARMSLLACQSLSKSVNVRTHRCLPIPLGIAGDFSFHPFMNDDRFCSPINVAMAVPQVNICRR